MKKNIALLLFLSFFQISHSFAIETPNDDFFKKCINENMAYFEYGIGVDTATEMPYDHIVLDSATQEVLSAGEYVNPTTIGLYLNILMLIDKGIINSDKISRNEAMTRIDKALYSLTVCPKWSGLFYWYNLVNGQMIPTSDQIISSVDNGNLSFSLAALIGGYFEDQDPQAVSIVKRSEDILNAQKTGWLSLYDKSTNLMYAGYTTATGSYSVGRLQAGYNPRILKQLKATNSGNLKDFLTYHVDRLFNESRLVPVWAILTTSNLPSGNQVPLDAFTNMQMFSTSYQPASGNTFTIYMTWDGTVFQELLPTILVNEFTVSPFMAQNHQKLISAQQDFITQKGLPSLLSASSTPDNGYASYGVPSISESYVTFHNPPPLDNAGTPHASALSNLADPAVAYLLLYNLKTKYPQIVTKHGWYDVIDSHGNTCTEILGLDQGMYILALTGHVNSFFVQKYLEREGSWNLLNSIYATLEK